MGEDDKVPVKIQCAIEQGQVKNLFLVFSNDNGANWYEVQMEPKEHGYMVEIPNVNVGTKIIYCFKAIDHQGNEIIEDNNGQYYSEIAKSAVKKPQIRKTVGPPGSIPQSPFVNKKVEENIAQETEKAVEKEKTMGGLKLEKPKLPVPKISTPKWDSDKPKLQTPEIKAPKIPAPKLPPKIDKPKVEEMKKPPKVAPPRIKKPKLEPPLVIKHGTLKKEPSISEPKEQKKQTDSLFSVAGKKESCPPEFGKHGISKFEEVAEKEKEKEKGKEDVFSTEVKAVDTEKTAITKTKVEKIPVEIYKEDNPKLAQPIVPFNPFTVDSGDVNEMAQPIQSFSQIIRFKPTSRPSSKGSQSKSKVSAAITNQCPKCQANLAKNWKICAMCGEKV